MSKILFIDVDGTLTGSKSTTEAPASAVYAVQQARKNGHLAYLCTGRSKAEVYQPIWDIGFDGMIGGNGCYVEDHGNIVMHQHLSAEQCRHAVDWCHSRNMEFYLEANSGLYASEHFKDKMIQGLSHQFGDKAEAMCDKFFPDMIYGADLYRDDVNKISYMLNSWQDQLDSRVEFPDLLPGFWGGKEGEAQFGDLGCKDITKGNAVNHLLAYLHRDIKDTIAFGDEAVDIPMFEICGTSVAMGSGQQAAKDAADYVTADTDDDGLYKAFVHLGLIEK